MAHDVFISYASEDKTVADAVCAMLESQGVRCWIAPRDVLPGVAYGEAIIDAIHGSRIMVLIFSSKANASPHIPKEIERAASRGVAVLPFRIEAVSPGKSLDYFIGSVHWLDAFTPPLEAHVKRLAENVRTLLSRGAPAVQPEQVIPPPTPMPPPAPTAPMMTPPPAPTYAAPPAATYAAPPVAQPVVTRPAPPVPPAVPAPAARPPAWLYAVLGAVAVAVIAGSLWSFLGHKGSGTSGSTASLPANSKTPPQPSNPPPVTPVSKPAPPPGADLYDRGSHAYTSEHYSEAADLWQQSCDAGFFEGCASAGTIYENGRGMAKDFTRAADLYKRACDNSGAKGCYNLGLMYAAGRGFAKDEARAADLYKTACDGKYVAGCTNAGVLYENGQGVKKDLSRAADFYGRSCQGSSPHGCVDLGMLYETGRGVARDKQRAADLYKKACDLGDATGCQSLTQLTGHRN